MFFRLVPKFKLVTLNDLEHSGGARGHPDGGAETPRAAAAPPRGMGRKPAVLLHLDSLG